MFKPRPLFAALVAVTAVAFFPSSASAANFGGCTDSLDTITVNVTADQFNTGAANECSLREAVQGANLEISGSTTIVVPAGTYSLTGAAAEDANASGDLDVTKPMTIQGAGARTTFIQTGTTLTNGIDRSIDVRATGNLTMTGTTVRFSRATTEGGGVRIVSLGTFAATDSAVVSNSTTNATSHGAGINNAGTLTLNRVLVASNDTTTNGADGGGIFTSGTSATLTNVTLTNNSDHGGSANGGAISFAGNASLTNVTVSHNDEDQLERTSGTVSLTNTIVSNSSQAGTGNSNCTGTFVNTNNNLDSGTSCGFGSANGSVSNANPNLGALADNGGPTDTRSIPNPGTASAARNAGTSSGAPSVDQRSAPRGPNVDIGAYEACEFTNPIAQSITYGANATFTTAVAGNLTASTVQWEVSTNGGGSWSNVPGATSTTLLLTKPGVALSGNLYRATFTGSSCSGSTNSALLTVTRKALTLSGAVAQNKVYNATTAATVDFTGASLNGVESGETVTFDSSGYSASFNNKNVGNSKPVTVSGVTLGGADAGNYTLTQPSLTANITPKDTTGSFTANNKAYDGNTSATINTQTVDAKEPGDTVNLTGTPTFDNKNVGNGKTVTLNSPSLTGADAGNYNLTTVSTTTANITQKNLTISGAVAQNKVYDATTAATVDFTGASLNGVVSGEAVTFDSSGYSASFNNKNVGNSKPVTVTGVTLGGADAGNYTLTQPSLTANITAKGLTISGAVAQNKVYDATTAATVNFTGASLNGVESGDTVTINSSGYSATFNNKNVGNGKPVTVTGVALGGADAGNYTVSQPSGLTANITPKDTTGSFTANNKTYDGTNSATIKTQTVDGKITGDTVNLTGTPTFDNKNVGHNKTVTLNSPSLTGADAANYNLTTVSTTDANINAKNLTLSGAVAQNKVYNATTAATVDFGSASLNGVETVDAGQVAFDATGYSASFNNKNVGNSKPVTVSGVVLTGAESGNYNLTQPSGLTANITKKDTTGSFTANNRAYDGTDNATINTATVDGKITGDTVNLTGTAKFDNKNVGNGKTVTLNSPSLTGTDAGNYNLTTVSTTTADITPKNTTGSFTANNKVYDATNAATVNTATVDGKITGDTVNLTGTATFDNKNAGNGKTVTLNSPNLTGADASNYNLTTVSTTTADITPKGLTISGASADNKVYDGTDTATVDFGSATLNGIEGTDDVTLDSSGYSASFNNKNVGDDKPVTVTGVALGGGDAGNYTVSQPTGLTADITAKGLTISGASADNKTYDGNTDATVDFTGASLDGVESGDTVTFDSSGYSASFNNKNVGNSKPVTVTGVTLGGADAGNYTLTQPSLAANITAKGLTISGASADNKVYDGTDTATVDFGSATLNGIEGTDDVTLDSSGYSASFNSKNVGNSKPVTVSGVTLGGADAGNYTVSQPTGLSADISPKDTTGSFTAENKVYDGTDAATIDTATVDGKETGDDVDLTGTATFDDKNVGNGKTVTLNSPSLTGTDAGNYNLTTVSTTMADITPKGLTVSGASANNKVYNGNDNATLDFTGASLNGIEGTDDVTLDSSGYSASFNNKNVGDDKPVTVTGVALDGADAGNYSVSQPSGLTADITAKDTTGSFTANNKVYDGTNSATIDTATVDAKETGDTVDLTGTATFDDENVGTGKTVTLNSPSLTGADASNYNLTTVSTATADITPKGLTISGAAADSKTYDGNTDATVDFTGASLNGVESGDTVTIDSSGYSASFNNKNVATSKPVTVTGVALDGADAGNYSLTQPSLTANITAKGLTVSGASANNKVYNGNNTATVNFGSASLNGIEGTDDVTLDSSGYSASFNNKNVGNGKPVTVTGVALGGGDAGNYTVSQPSGLTADITAKDTTGSFTANNKAYDGTDAATIDTATVDGKETGDDVDLTGTATFDDENVGNGKTVTLNSPSLTGTDAGNYNLTTVSTTMADITPKGLTISGASADNKVYDGTDTATVDFGSATLNGIEGTDDVTLNSSGYSASFNNKNVGDDKPVTVTGVALDGADAGNYSVSQPTGLTADITAKGLTISGAQAQNKAYDGTDAGAVNFGSASLNGVESGDTVTIDSSSYSASFNNANVGTGKPVTVSGVALGGADAGNYSVSQPTGLTADITPKGLTISGASANNKVYNGNDTATVDFGSATLNGVESGDTVTIDSTSTPYSATFNNKNVGNNKPVTVTGVTLGGADAGNYTVSQPTGLTANITPKGLTISGEVAQSKVYDGTPSATVDLSGASLNGAESGDTVGIASSGHSASFNNKNRGNGKPVSLTGVALTGADAGNYTVSPPGGLTADITPKDVTGSFSAADKVYDGNTSATASGKAVNGEVAGDAVSLTGGTAAFNNPNVGTNKPVTLSGASLAGTDATNYNLTGVSAASADITRKSVTGHFTAADKDFDGTRNAVITGRSLSGAVAGDDVSLAGGAAFFVDPNPGVDKTIEGFGFTLAGTDQGNYSLGTVSDATATINQRGPAPSEPPTEEEIEQGASQELGGDVKPLGTDFGNLAFGFAPEDQGKKLDPTNQALFALGCTDDCDIAAKKTVVLTTGDDAASAAATKKLKLKTQNMSLASGELGVVKLKLTRKQKKAIKKAQKAKLVVKTTVTSDGGTAAGKKAYKLKT